MTWRYGQRRRNVHADVAETEATHRTELVRRRNEEANPNSTIK